MTEQRTPDRLTTLDDLKRAISLIPWHLENAPADYGGLSFERERAEAWHTAFEWRSSMVTTRTGLTEFEEGMRLIREKLK
jgi:hypothetical protein